MTINTILMFMFTGVLISSSTLLTGSIIWRLMRISYYFWITDLGAELASALLIVAGAIICLPACLLMTQVTKHSKSVSIHGAILCLSVTALMMLGIGVTGVGGLSRSLRDTSAVNSSMMHSLSMIAVYPTVKMAVNESFASMQLKLGCCGVQSPSDWKLYKVPLPPSCCGRTKTVGEVCGKESYKIGCLRLAMTELRGFTNYVTTLTSSIILIMSVTLSLAAYNITVSAEATDTKKFQANPVGITCVTYPAPLSAFIPSPATSL